MQGFKLIDLQRLIKFLRNLFNLNCEIRKKTNKNNNKLDWFIVITDQSENIQTFLNLIQPYIIKSMRKKITQTVKN